MSEGPYRNMSYDDAANAMRRIYEILYARRFHSYNPSLSEPFADYVGTRSESASIPSEFTKLYGAIGNVVEKYSPILGDISYSEGDTADETPAGKSKVILDLHGMAILNSLLEVAELGAKYINLVSSQLYNISTTISGSTPLAEGNKIASPFKSILTSVDTTFSSKYGFETLARVKNMITKLSSGSRSGVMAKNVNVVKSIDDYQVGQEEVISDAFDKDFIEYFIMYLEAENDFHDSVKDAYDANTNDVRTSEMEYYESRKSASDPAKTKKKFARYIDVSGCRSSCVGLCIGSCANTCFGCSDKCSGQCTAMCADCSKGCMTNCMSTCQGTCNNECIGCSNTCSAGCITGCESDCGDTCTYDCHSACAGSCYGTAEGYSNKCGDCGTSCKGACGNSCENTTSSITPGPIATPMNIEIDPIVTDPGINPNPQVNRPS